MNKELLRIKRHRAIRSKITGTPERPRLSVHRSLSGLQVQVIDDTTGTTILSGLSYKKKMGEGTGVERAKKLGQDLAKRAADKKIKAVVFDRGGFHYHGQVKAFADTLREEGITI